MHTIWNPREKIQIKRGGHSKKRDNFFVFACRTGELLQEWQPLSTAVRQAESDLKQESQEQTSEEGGYVRDPDPDVEARHDFWSIVGDYMNRNHVARRTELYVFFWRTIFRYFWIVLVFGDKEDQVLIYFQMQPWMIIGTRMERRHCLNHGLVWRVSRFSTKIHEKDVCGFKAEWRRNMSQQDQETFGQKNGQIRREDHSVKPCIQGLKKQNWTLRENSDAFTSFPTMI